MTKRRRERMKNGQWKVQIKGSKKKRKLSKKQNKTTKRQRQTERQKERKRTKKNTTKVIKITIKHTKIEPVEDWFESQKNRKKKTPTKLTYRKEERHKKQIKTE